MDQGTGGLKICLSFHLDDRRLIQCFHSWHAVFVESADIALVRGIMYIFGNFVFTVGAYIPIRRPGSIPAVFQTA